MQTHGCPDFSCPKEWLECPLLFTECCQDPLTSFIAYVNIFDLPRRAQGTEYAGTAGYVALDWLVGCLELGVS